MAGEYEVWLTTDKGVRLALLDNFVRLQYSIVVNDMGQFIMDMPSKGFDDRLLEADNVVQVWRSAGGSRLNLERAYIVRYYRYEEDSSGLLRLRVGGLGFKDLLRRRIIAYAGGLAFTEKTGYADDLLTEFVDENLISAIDTNRNLDFFTSGAAVSKGPIVFVRSEWQNLFAELQRISKASRSAGTEVFFDVVLDSVTAISFTCRFLTYTGQPGSDRSNDYMVLSREKGSLSQAFYEFDAMNAQNYIYALGQSTGSSRRKREVEDTARSERSRFGRVEGYFDARDGRDDDEVDKIANDVLSQARPVRRFGGKVIDTDGARYGVHWQCGDKVQAEFMGRRFVSIVRSVSVTVEQDKESIDARVEWESND